MPLEKTNLVGLPSAGYQTKTMKRKKNNEKLARALPIQNFIDFRLRPHKLPCHECWCVGVGCGEGGVCADENTVCCGGGDADSGDDLSTFRGGEGARCGGGGGGAGPDPDPDLGMGKV